MGREAACAGVTVRAAQHNFIDLFAGCGGLSEGFYMQGFRALAHVEIDGTACRTLRTRMRHYGYEDAEQAVLNLDITGDGWMRRFAAERWILLSEVRRVRRIRVSGGRRTTTPCRMIRETICSRVM